MKSKLHGKRERQLREMERDAVQIASYEQALVEDKDNKVLKKKIERVKVVIENTRKRLV